MRRLLRALAVVVVLAAAGGWFAAGLYRSPGPLPEAKAVMVPRASARQIGAVLQREGVVASPAPFAVAALLTRPAGALHSAELLFPAHASLREVLAVLRFGKPVQHKLTIPEGITATEVAELVAAAPALDGDMPIPAEGSVLPQTYLYEHGAARAAVVERARRAMGTALAVAWAGRSPDSAPLTSPGDVLTLASIVERETSHAEERPLVAAVFLNRLRRGMKLQSDPTVIYGASGGAGVLDHGLTRVELDRDDPYNTYRIAGLPPGPICMPGPASLQAVTHPAPSDDLYFVADGTGGHAFARTEADHLRNVARWRDVERQRLQPASGPPSGPSSGLGGN